MDQAEAEALALELQPHIGKLARVTDETDRRYGHPGFVGIVSGFRTGKFLGTADVVYAIFKDGSSLFFGHSNWQLEIRDVGSFG